LSKWSSLTLFFSFFFSQSNQLYGVRWPVAYFPLFTLSSSVFEGSKQATAVFPLPLAKLRSNHVPASPPPFPFPLFLPLYKAANWFSLYPPISDDRNRAAFSLFSFFFPPPSSFPAVGDRIPRVNALKALSLPFFSSLQRMVSRVRVIFDGGDFPPFLFLFLVRNGCPQPLFPFFPPSGGSLRSSVGHSNAPILFPFLSSPPPFFGNRRAKTFDFLFFSSWSDRCLGKTWPTVRDRGNTLFSPPFLLLSFLRQLGFMRTEKIPSAFFFPAKGCRRSRCAGSLPFSPFFFSLFFSLV